jgi:hypothetical protein
MRKIFLPLVVIFLLVQGCGYTLHGKKDFLASDVRIGKIENRTREPRLDDILTKALSDEALKQGLAINRASQYEIHGTIDRFDFRGVSEREEVFEAYEVIVGGKFFLRTADGGEVILKGENPFIYTFPAKADLNVVFAERERAVGEAMSGLAAEIVAGIIYR